MAALLSDALVIAGGEHGSVRYGKTSNWLVVALPNYMKIVMPLFLLPSVMLLMLDLRE